MSSAKQHTPDFFEKATLWIGSVPSIITHTIVFASAFSLSVFGIVAWGFMLLVLTTILSLEAIYLAIFIQLTVNRHTTSLREVEEDIDEIQEDVGEIQGDVDEIQEDVEEMSEDVEDLQENIEGIQEDIEEISENEAEHQHDNAPQSTVTLETLSRDIHRILVDIEALKSKK